MYLQALSCRVPMKGIVLMSNYDKTKFFKDNPNDVINAFNSFMTPDFQKSLLDLASTSSDFSDAISVDVLNQFSNFSKLFSDTSGIITFFNEFNDHINSIFSPEFVSCLSNMVNSINSLSNIVESNASAFSYLADYSANDDSEDYVILNEAPIRELNIPNEIAITVGHNRIRMSTATFIGIISVILATFTSIGSFIADRIDSTNSSEDTAQLLEYERDQTIYLKELFNSLDTSNSSQKEFLEDTRSVFQSQDEVQDTSLESTDNSRE